MKHFTEKLIYRIDDINKILNGEFPFPKTVDVNLTETCNLNCLGCHTKEFRAANKFMPKEVFERNCDDWSKIGVKGVIFTGGGEPCLHPLFDDFVKYSLSKGLKVGCITNGTIPKDALTLCDWVRVSLNAVNHDGYRKHAGKDFFGKAIKTLLWLKQYPVKLGAKFLLSKVNNLNEETIKEFCDGIGIKFYQIKDLRNCEDSLVDDVRKNKKGRTCGLTPLKAVIDYDGTYYSCPFFHHHPNTAIGNSTISEIWGTEKHKLAIENINKDNCCMYDCAFLDVDWDRLKQAEVAFI